METVVAVAVEPTAASNMSHAADAAMPVISTGIGADAGSIAAVPSLQHMAVDGIRWNIDLARILHLLTLLSPHGFRSNSVKQVLIVMDAALNVTVTSAAMATSTSHHESPACTMVSSTIMADTSGPASVACTFLNRCCMPEQLPPAASTELGAACVSARVWPPHSL